jgi:hypothetical protein
MSKNDRTSACQIFLKICRPLNEFGTGTLVKIVPMDSEDEGMYD